MMISQIIQALYESILQSQLLPKERIPDIVLEMPKDLVHGDLSTNIAFHIAKLKRIPVNKIAELIVSHLVVDNKLIKKVDIAGNGFINFYFADQLLYDILTRIISEGSDYGRSDWGGNEKVQVEFVSANPTGPLSVVQARAAAVGDALVNLLSWTGHNVKSEYYVNDVGHQIDVLGKSVEIRYHQLLGKPVELPDECYPGEYIIDLARRFITQEKEKLQSLGTDERIQRFKTLAVTEIVDWHKKDLQLYGTEFDNWFFESTIHSPETGEEVLTKLKQQGYTYEHDNALWFKSVKFGDDKDRVLVKSDGEPTYLLPDVVYHINKFDRGFQRVIDIWGPDHHGHILPLKSVIKSLDYPSENIEILIVQWITLLRNGKKISMSKRAGEFITLNELVQEIGNDVSRFFFLMRRINSHLDFDIDLAKKTTEENPVYYVQYAHARICSILKFAEESGILIPSINEVQLTLLKAQEELTILKLLLNFPEIVSECARIRDPFRITYYLQELAKAFHYFYQKHRVVTQNNQLTYARLILIKAVQTVLKNALGLIGVSAPQRM